MQLFLTVSPTLSVHFLGNLSDDGIIHMIIWVEMEIAMQLTTQHPVIVHHVTFLGIIF